MDNQKKIRIGIDARFYGPIGKGLGRYTQEVVDRVIVLNPEFEYVIFLGPENFDNFQSSNNNYRKVRIDIRWYSWQEQLLLPFYFYRENLDLLHFTHFNVPIFYRRPFVVTIHDLILTKFPSLKATLLKPWMYRLKNLAYRLVIKQAVRHAKKIIAVSRFTADDLVKKFKISPRKIEIIYEGVAEEFLQASKADSKVLLKYGFKDPFLLYVGNAYPHKNLEGLIKVFTKFKSLHTDSKVSLVLVGKEDYFYSQLKKFTASLSVKDLYFPGYVPDNDLAIFFSSALAYVFPSFYEGFGLPPLEAMARSCPVLSSKEGSLPEVLGEAAFYFDPYSQDDFLEKLERITSDQKLRESLCLAGPVRAKYFSWFECALQTSTVYKQCLLNHVQK